MVPLVVTTSMVIYQFDSLQHRPNDDEILMVNRVLEKERLVLYDPSNIAPQRSKQQVTNAG